MPRRAELAVPAGASARGEDGDHESHVKTRRARPTRVLVGPHRRAGSVSRKPATPSPPRAPMRRLGHAPSPRPRPVRVGRACGGLDVVASGPTDDGDSGVADLHPNFDCTHDGGERIGRSSHASHVSDSGVDVDASDANELTDADAHCRQRPDPPAVSAHRPSAADGEPRPADGPLHEHRMQFRSRGARARYSHLLRRRRSAILAFGGGGGCSGTHAARTGTAYGARAIGIGAARLAVRAEGRCADTACRSGLCCIVPASASVSSLASLASTSTPESLASDASARVDRSPPSWLLRTRTQTGHAAIPVVGGRWLLRRAHHGPQPTRTGRGRGDGAWPKRHMGARGGEGVAGLRETEPRAVWTKLGLG